MPKLAYTEHRFSSDSAAIISQANVIIEEYEGQGYKLTLRQLYYQFVSRDFIPNNMRSYKRLGSIVNDARLAGLIDWNSIEDRTRETVLPPHWESPAEIISAAARSYRIDKWQGQDFRPEVWIEKEALAGVIAGVCRELDIAYLSCRGYTSQSEMWSSAMRLKTLADEAGQTPVILHFGDHDPSGIDMTRDIEDRLRLFTGGVELRRLALNMEQVEQYGPPPNPAKTTDARFASYRRTFGEDSWELDALEPRVLEDLIREEVEQLREARLWSRMENKEGRERALLESAAAAWPKISKTLLRPKP